MNVTLKNNIYFMNALSVFVAAIFPQFEMAVLNLFQT